MKKYTGQHTRQRGFTLVELMIVLLVLGVLAALIYPTVSRSRDSGFDVVKKHNEKQLNACMLALYEAGVKTTGTAYADAAATIATLKGGVTIDSTIAGWQAQIVKIDVDVNPLAYTFTPAAADGSGPAIFVAKLRDRDTHP